MDADPHPIVPRPVIPVDLPFAMREPDEPRRLLTLHEKRPAQSSGGAGAQ